MCKLSIYLVLFICFMEVLAGCSNNSSKSDNSNSTANHSTDNQATTNDPLEILQKQNNNYKNLKSVSYIKKMHLEHTFTTAESDGFRVTQTNIRNSTTKTDYVNNPYKSHSTTDIESAFVTPGVDGQDKPKPGEWNKFKEEEYEIGNMYYSKVDNQAWQKVSQNVNNTPFSSQLIDKIIANKDATGIKMTEEHGEYKIVISKNYFDKHSDLFGFYKKNFPFMHLTDYIEKRIKSEAGETIQYDQAQFKDPEMILIVNKNTLQRKELMFHSNLRIPTVSSKFDKKGKPQIFPPVYIDETSTIDYKGEFTGTIQAPQ
ncbi:hypothetical protein MK805_02950 [Shimazuella sp. AN120528]|uniref:hypothetical protein n=1 Tax=Shimazuella soli TaxID=1892854 RepID=UPI001F0DA94B|nr:hypothetical protein [Shimazuella soli]MCH5583925.1 hypothetical protein [Shimazuella soli]